jgi:hypothetical protein
MEGAMGVNVEKDQVGVPTSPAGGEAGSSNGGAASSEAVEAERNPIFDALVKVEGEVSGLVAYSIYKQNKRAWLNDFQKMVGRPPTEAETRAYIIGESTQRRLATYRHLAQATLAGEGPEAPAAAKGAGGRSSSFYLVWAVVLIVAVAVLAYAYYVSVPAARF